MKQIFVEKNCSGCGLCIVNCSYLQENADGNAEYIIGKSIQNSDMNEVKKVIDECPEHALHIVEINSTNKKGDAGVVDIIDSLKNYCENFSVKKVSNSDVKLNIDDYYVPIPSSSKEYRRDYTSESSARSAAKEEFNLLCYSETAYNPMIKKVFVEYKVNILKPYYTCTDTEDSAYYAYNQEIRNKLSDAYAEIDELLGGNNNIPDSWREFAVYLSKRLVDIELLKDFDDQSKSSGVVSKMRSIRPRLDDYFVFIGFDYDQRYNGESIFGKIKFKNEWYFTGFYDAAKEYIGDLTWAIGIQSDEIENVAVRFINYALDEFEKEIKEELNIKISELEQYVKKI